jgi:flagellar hook-associated protein 1 FlgK
MGILSTLLSSANSLRVYDQEFATIQNNIANSNTPDFASQNLTLVADSFDPSASDYGGVSTGTLENTRSQYLEQQVRTQTTLLGFAQQTASDLAPLQSLFSLTSATGISGSLNTFFNAFSALSVAPNDAEARQTVLTAAQGLATSFNQAAQGITAVSSDVETETSNTVTSINQIASDLASINEDYAKTGGTANAGLDAEETSDLENLSQIANFTVIHTTQGQINVYLGGQTPLVMGTQPYTVSADFSTPQTIIRDSEGNDITSQITGGQLGAQIQENNVTLPGYTASLNTLAQTLADTVNNTLSAGVDVNGNPPATNLFSYDTTADAAFTFAVTPGMTGDQLAAALPSSPGGNANALAVGNLATAPEVNGFSFTEAFGNLGQQVGSDISSATSAQTEQQNLVTQAQAQRTAVSGVSLDQQAALLLQFQQAYEGVSKVVSTLNNLTDALMNMMPTA